MAFFELMSVLDTMASAYHMVRTTAYGISYIGLGAIAVQADRCIYGIATKASPPYGLIVAPWFPASTVAIVASPTLPILSCMDSKVIAVAVAGITSFFSCFKGS